MDVENQVRSFSPFHIDSFVRIENGQWWRFTGFYGDPDPSQRCQSWKLLKRISRMYSGPWAVGGDFNEIVSQSEKMGGLPKPRYLINNFRKALDSCQLRDVGYEGSDYTWCNGRKNDLIFERLDRVCGNLEWFDMFPSMKVRHLDRTNSDHCPLLLMEYDPHVKRHNTTRWRTRFHFESAWAEDEECSNIVQSVWQQDKKISNTRELQNRLGKCGQPLQQWNKSKKQEMTRHLKEYEDKISLLSRSTNVQDWQQMQELERKQNVWLDKEEKFWKQRRRALWLKEGDKNTKFFHRKASNRKAKNTIQGLIDDRLQWITGNRNMGRVACDYFQHLFTSNPATMEELQEFQRIILHRISRATNDYLLEPFTEEEVFKAMRDIHPQKAPGSDGLPGLFYRKYWSLIGPEISKVCLEFSMKG
uniref:Reverse transcriptase n=1 Tax=Cannabis sativa TaxID=3483 RepID=A0A803QMV0_CANSA